MKKNLTISSAFLAAIMAFTACKKDKPDPLDITPDDAFELPYNHEGVAANKRFVEEEGRAIIRKFDALPESQAISALTTLAALDMPDVDIAVSAVARLGRETNKVAAMGRALTMVAEANAIRLSSVYGIYEYNHNLHSWNKTASSEKLEFHFPAVAGGQTNNAVLTLTYTSSGQFIELDGAVELPTAINASLTVGGQEVLKLVSSYAYESDGMPKDIDVRLSMDKYGATLLAEKGASTKAEIKFSVDDEDVAAASLQADTRSYSFETFEDESFLMDMVGEANASLRVGNLELLGLFDVRGFINAMPDVDYPEYPNYYDYFTGYEEWGSPEYEAAQSAWDEAVSRYNAEFERVDELLVGAEVEALKNYSKFVAVNLDSRERIATLDFQPYEEEYCWDDICYTYFYYEPVLVFGDESRVSLEDFVDTGFDRLISDLEGLIAKLD